MLTRTEEDIVVLENEEKNDEILMEWVKGKEGKRNVTDSRQLEVAPEGSTGSPTEVPTGTPTTEAAQGSAV